MGGSCNGPACFPAGTPISVDNAQRPIEEIKTGDTVLAMDPNTKALTRSRVAQTFVRLATAFVVVFAGGDSIASTSEHPYWTSQHGWTEAKYLTTGDSLWMPTSGQLLAIDSLRAYETAPTKVFNFEVEGVHNYLVGSLGIAVHNAPCPEAGGSYPVKDGQIFRASSGTPYTMTPRPNDVNGLSGSISLETALPGKNQVIDASKLSNLCAVCDNPATGHVSIRPKDPRQMQGWMDSRGGSDVHPLTQELMDAVTGTVKK